MKTSSSNRLQFLGATARAAGFAFPMIVDRRVLGGAGFVPPSESDPDRVHRRRPGQQRQRRQGIANLKAIQKEKGAEVVAVCDVDKDHLAKAKTLAESTGRPCLDFADYRKLLDDKSIDAVVISTPDHWHALPTDRRLPRRQGRLLREAAQPDRRRGQGDGRGRPEGQPDRPDRQPAALRRPVPTGLRAGPLRPAGQDQDGPDQPARRSTSTGPAVPDSAPPPELDYQTWLGPAPDRPYNEKHVHYLFRFFWDYSGGQMTNFGAHHLDIAQWGLGRDESGPVSIEATARFHKDGWYEVPEQQRDRLHLRRRHQGHLRPGRQGRPERPVRGDQGLDRRLPRQDRVDPGRDPQGAAQGRATSTSTSARTTTRTGSTASGRASLPICDVAIGHRSATVCHLGNIAIRVGRKLTWDPVAETHRRRPRGRRDARPALPIPLAPARVHRQGRRDPSAI